MVLADLGDEARHVDDVAARAPQVREGELAGVEDADEVQLEQVAELFDGELVNRLVRRVPPGVVNEAVYPPVAGERDLDEVPEVFLPPHVAEDEGGVAGCLRHAPQGRRGGGALGLDVAADDDFRARPDELLRAALPDAAAAAGDDDDLVRVPQTRH